MIFEKPLANWTYNLEESEIRRLLKVKTKYYMAGGLPSRLPLKIFSKIFKDISEEFTSEFGDDSILNYGATEGLQNLRELLSDRMYRTEDVAGDVFISAGSQQTIYSVLKIICNPGDVLIAPEPTYLGFLGPCKILGIKVLGIPNYEEGITIEDLQSAINESLYNN